MKSGRSVFYAVIAPSSEDEDELTENTSHELAEAITDPIEGTGWIWEDPISGKLEEIADACFPDIATVHGYSISQFLASSPEPGRLICAPLPDQVPRGVSTSAAIEVDSGLTRVTCLTGGILEGQTAFFKVRANYHDAPASLTSYSWFASSPDGGLVEPGGNQAPEFSVIVPFGMKTLVLRVEVTTSLGCLVEAVRSFTVFTQDQSDAERAACDSLARFREIAHIYHWPLPFLLPGAPADAGEDRLNVGVLNRLQTFGEAMVEFARTARPIARLVEAQLDRGGSGEEPDSARHRKRVRSRQAHR